MNSCPRSSPDQLEPEITNDASSQQFNASLIDCPINGSIFPVSNHVGLQRIEPQRSPPYASISNANNMQPALPSEPEKNASVAHRVQEMLQPMSILQSTPIEKFQAFSSGTGASSDASNTIANQLPGIICPPSINELQVIPTNQNTYTINRKEPSHSPKKTTEMPGEFPNPLKRKHDPSPNQRPADLCRYLGDGFWPSSWDVVFGRGKHAYDHIGNRRLKILVAMNLQKYIEANNLIEKSDIVDEIIGQIKDASSGVGFVKQDSNGRWYEIDLAATRGKVARTFRDSLAGLMRRNSELTSDEKSRSVIKAQNTMFRSCQIRFTGDED